MHKRLDWNLILENIIKFIIALWAFKTMLSLMFPVILLSLGEQYKKNLYTFLINNSTNIFTYYDVEEDSEKINTSSIIIKYLTGIDIYDLKSVIALEIPLINQIDKQILLAKEEGPVIVVPRVEEDLDDEEKIEQNEEEQDKQQQTENTNQNEDIKVIDEKNLSSPKKKKLDPRKPLVLIYHTHTTETYNKDGNVKNFTTDSKYNLIRVGDELKKELEEKYGIATIHDTTYHDVPKREGAYSKSRPTVQKYLKKYNTFQIIIDLHRDASVSRSKTTAIIKDKSYARVMFVVDTLNKNHTKNNITTSKINDTLNLLYPGFSRGIMYKQSKLHYNQDLSSKIILIEVGSTENSLEEAINTAQILARAIAQNIN
ncbi:stage II sporulation protein P [Caloramator mitchellensis]|nr:stage II sporulation protein P [Caloramator mitchellensis]